MQFLLWIGPALMVSIAYMDPGNYGTDITAGAGYQYTLLWAGWLASGMAMLLQYLSGKLGIASGRSLPELVRSSLRQRRYVIPFWLASEAAAAATDLAEYLGTVLGLNILSGFMGHPIPLIYCAIFGALDVILLLTMMTRRFRLVEQYFALLISILVVGIFYNLFVVKPDLTRAAIGSVIPLAPSNAALLIVVGMVGATVMPHALFVHSWLTKNKMDMIQGRITGTPAPTITDSLRNGGPTPRPHSIEEKKKTNRLHRDETIVALTVAGVVNAGILLVAVPLFQGTGVNVNLTVSGFISSLTQIYGPLIGILFALTLLASGLSSSALGTIAGQVIMEGLIGKKWNIWARRLITRFVNVFPTTVAILLGLSPLVLLVYSQVILSLMIPLPAIPLVYYTSKGRFMGELVNGRAVAVLAAVVVVIILGLNGYLIANFV
ncbi:MAG: Nramp family divalent metal transporter [Nitrososphaerota archaeon]|nr:Nramp family divalent metal transporter [Nitrososphaerota archaeon]MDG6950838.1 Nramp family divalent metal transporter [Nitrososphaerota archaeon]